MYTEDEETPNLPADVLRKVIAYANHSIKEMQLVSHTWKHLVSQEYSKLSNLPPIDELEISTERLPFGNVIVAELKMRKGFGFTLNEFHKFGYNLASETDKVVTSRKILYEVVLQNTTDAFSAIRRINRITLKEMQTRTDKLECLFRGVRSDNIQIIEQKMTDAYSEAVLKLIKDWKVRKASFIVQNVYRRTFMKEIAGCVYTLYIKQVGATTYLLGRQPDERWLQTLVDMFAKRVTKIKVEHDNVHIVANHSVTKFFNEHFSKQSGRPWLEINAQREFRAHVSKNGFVLDGNG
ncbi:hypothetical protein PRIPAC_84795 [Pristionchus pacificus]|nr:hypothetical protein PRIPAC_84795 [Pristionchus pacificus]